MYYNELAVYMYDQRFPSGIWLWPIPFAPFFYSDTSTPGAPMGDSSSGVDHY
jgi:hypothetical protein